MNERMTLEELQDTLAVCIDEVIKLKQENAKLNNEVKNLARALLDSINNEKEYMSRNDSILNDVLLHFEICDKAFDNLRYELSDPNMPREGMYYPKIYPLEKTIDDIINHGASMARFGDGEFAIMANKNRQKFQTPNERLRKRLSEVIAVCDEKFLVGIADNYGALDKYNDSGKKGIRFYMSDEVRREHAQFLDLNRYYHNAYISRPYALFADNTTDAPKKRFSELKRIWNNRNIIFVEGSKTRLGVGNDLFDNAAGIRRIVAPPTNSFDKYDEILEAALNIGNKDTLFLIALGPSAGVLAYDLYLNGFQALDIGHVDLEYEYFLNGSGSRCIVKNKYNNEVPGGDLVEDIHDELYESQIIYDFSKII